MTKSQNEKILTFLSKRGARLTAAQARSRFGVQNLRARIYELRESGHDIRTTQMKENRSSTPTTAYTLAQV